MPRRKKSGLKVCVVEQSWTVKHAAEQYKIRRGGARRNEVGVNTVVQDKGARNEMTRNEAKRNKVGANTVDRTREHGTR